MAEKLSRVAQCLPTVLSVAVCTVLTRTCPFCYLLNCVHVIPYNENQLKTCMDTYKLVLQPVLDAKLDLPSLTLGKGLPDQCEEGAI